MLTKDCQNVNREEKDLDPKFASIADLGLEFLEHAEFVSPLSVFFSLSMIAQGAQGSTRDEILQLLPMMGEIEEADTLQRLGELSLNIARDYRPRKRPTATPKPKSRVPSLVQDPFLNVTIGGMGLKQGASGGGSESVDSSGYAFYLANSIWVRYDLPIKPSFVELVQSKCGGVVKSFRTGREINDSIQSETKGALETAVGQLSSRTTVVAVNALYFKGSWEHAFDPRPPLRDFELEDDTTVSVHLMHQRNILQYIETESLGQFVALPYRRGKDQSPLEALLVLPPKSVHPKEILPQLLDGALQEIRQYQMSEQRVELFLPRFHIDATLQVMDILQDELGVRSVFDIDEANLSGLTECSTAFVSNMVQRILVQVDESGTVAAAVTYEEVVTRSHQIPRYKVVRCDRPFLFLIQNPETGLVSFAGVVSKRDHF